jgi:hypothetical protein
MDRILKAQVNIPVGTLPVKGFRLVGRIQIPVGIKEHLKCGDATNSAPVHEIA